MKYEGKPLTLTKELFKFWYCALKGIDTIPPFNFTVTQARELINMMMDHEIEDNIPLKDSGVDRTNDINKIFIHVYYKSDLLHMYEDML